MERGRSCLRFSALEPYHFTPVLLKRPPIYAGIAMKRRSGPLAGIPSCSGLSGKRSEEHTSELQSRFDLVCRRLLEKKNSPERQSRSDNSNRPMNITRQK